MCGEHQSFAAAATGSRGVSSRIREGGVWPFPERESLVSRIRVRRGRPDLGGPNPSRGAPPSPPPDALVAQACSLAGRGLTAALSLLSVVIAARECGCKGSELPPSGKETPGRRKSPSRSREKGGKRAFFIQFVCLVGIFFKKNRYLFLKKETFPCYCLSSSLGKSARTTGT